MSSNDKKEVLLVPSKSETDRFQAERQEISETLRDFIADLNAIREQLRQGEVERKSETKSILTEMRYWLKAARETEAELEKIRRNECGVAGAWGLDLDAARLEIGCRLARLRECCDAEEVSE